MKVREKTTNQGPDPKNNKMKVRILKTTKMKVQILKALNKNVQILTTKKEGPNIYRGRQRSCCRSEPASGASAEVKNYT